MDGEGVDYVALPGLVNILDIPVALVSSLVSGEGLHIIYPSNRNPEKKLISTALLWWAMKRKATSIAFSRWMQKQQMYSGELMKIKFSQNAEKLTAIPKASMRETMVSCRSMPTTVCFVNIVYQRQNENERQNQHITRYNVLDDRD